MAPHASLTGWATLLMLAVGMAGCADTPQPTAPSPALVLSAAEPVLAGPAPCVPCDPTDVRLVTEFPVTIADPAGPGGTLVSVTTVVRNTSRGSELGRNVRPNASVGLPTTTLPAGGRLTVSAGLVFPVPPPRDALEVIVTVVLTDGRRASRAWPLVATQAGAQPSNFSKNIMPVQPSSFSPGSEAK